MHGSPNTTLTTHRAGYRPDIDGLRAVAVMAVIGFHVFPKALPGGFVGVDIFFVISGFLISSIIFEALDGDRFSFVQFYARRILRIFPALITVIAVSLLAGWLVLPGYLLDELGRESIAGALFCANFFFWDEAGYFDSTAAQKPLLHLWSLGVEEQFYLLWPAGLYFCFRRRRYWLAMIAIVGVASFMLRRIETWTDPVAAFYLPQYRFWELMLGALCAHPWICGWLKDNRRLASAFSVVGTLGVGYSIAFVDAHQILLSKTVLALVVSPLLVIAGGGAWINRRLLAHPIPVAIGKISYPLYLWHWPLLYFYRWSERQLGWGDAIVIALSVVLAVLTYRFIELPLQRRKTDRLPLLKLSAGLITTMATVLLFCAVTVNYRGFPDREVINVSALPEDQAKLKAQIMRVFAMRYNFAFADLYGERPCFRYKETQTAEMFIKNGCLQPEFAGRPNVFIFGDSHAAALSIGLKPLFASQRINFERLTYGWCTPTDGRHNPTCDAMNAMALERISELKPDIVILDSYWLAASKDYRGPPPYSNGILSLVSEIRRRGAGHVVLVGQMPLYDSSLPQKLVEDYVNKNLPIPMRVKSAVPASLEMDDMMRAIPYPDGVEYVSLRGALCDHEGCLDSVGPDITHDILLWDYGHLTAAGSEYVARTVMMPVILQALDAGADGISR